VLRRRFGVSEKLASLKEGWGKHPARGNKREGQLLGNGSTRDLVLEPDRSKGTLRGRRRIIRSDQKKKRL